MGTYIKRLIWLVVRETIGDAERKYLGCRDVLLGHRRYSSEVCVCKGGGGCRDLGCSEGGWVGVRVVIIRLRPRL